MKIIFSLVLYKHSYEDIFALLNDIDNFHNFASFENILSELRIYDNSPKKQDNFGKIFDKNYIKYFLDTRNIGFGKAHNMNLLHQEKVTKKT